MPRAFAFLLALGVLAGCAAPRGSISVRAAPGPYKPFEIFLADQQQCGRMVHDTVVAPANAATPPESDDALQKQVDKAYGDCMTARGDQVWGYPALTRAAPPPPPDTPPPPNLKS